MNTVENKGVISKPNSRLKDYSTPADWKRISTKEFTNRTYTCGIKTQYMLGTLNNQVKKAEKEPHLKDYILEIRIVAGYVCGRRLSYGRNITHWYALEGRARPKVKNPEPPDNKDPENPDPEKCDLRCQLEKMFEGIKNFIKENPYILIGLIALITLPIIIGLLK